MAVYKVFTRGPGAVAVSVYPTTTYDHKFSAFLLAFPMPVEADTLQDIAVPAQATIPAGIRFSSLLGARNIARAFGSINRASIFPHTR